MTTQRNSNRFPARSTRSQTLLGSTTGVCRNSSAGDLFIEDVHRMIAFSFRSACERSACCSSATVCYRMSTRSRLSWPRLERSASRARCS